MIVRSLPGEHRFLLRPVSWQTYERLLEELGDQPGMRLAYLHGSLELMSPSESHEWIKRLIGRVIEVFTLERGIPIKSGGSTTWRRRDLERGLEPDECYWVQSEPKVRGRAPIDLAVDPAPDLAVEVEISKSSVDKLAIYAGLGIGEVWRHDGEALTILVRGADGEYRAVARSVALPALPPDEVARVVDRRELVDETALLREFVLRVRGDFPA